MTNPKSKMTKMTMTTLTTKICVTYCLCLSYAERQQLPTKSTLQQRVA